MFALIGCLIGCGSSELTYPEARVVYEAFSSVNADVYAALDTFSAPDRESASGADTAGKPTQGFEGTVLGPGSWEGAIHVVSDNYVVATTGRESWSVVWSLQVEYADVTYGDLELDAAFAWDIETVAGKGSFEHDSRAIGDFVARGAPAGAGAFDFQTQVSLTGGGCQMVISRATVAGHELFSESGGHAATDKPSLICL